MAHKSHEPARLQSRKKRLPHDRGEKYVAPDASPDYEPTDLPPGSRGPAHRGNAHDLLMEAPPTTQHREVRPQWPSRWLGLIAACLALAGIARAFRR